MNSDFTVEFFTAVSANFVLVDKGLLPSNVGLDISPCFLDESK
jgi:hypothetical protein